MHRTIFTLLALATTACSSPTAPTPGRAESDTTHATNATLADAEQLLRAGDAYGALDVTDQLLRKDPDSRAARALAARANLHLGQSGVKNAAAFLETAARQFEYALGLDGNDADAWTDLARVRLMLSRFSDGRDAAIRAAQVAEAAGARAKVGTALLEAAANEMQMFVAERNAEISGGTDKPGEASMKAGLAVIARLKMAEQNGASLGVTKKRTADVLRWLDRPAEALNELQNAVRADPNSIEANTSFQEVWWQMNGHRECVAAYKQMLKESTSSAPLQFYLGRAQVALADKQRTDGRAAEALISYQEALDTWTAYHQARPQDAALSTHWMAICELSLARVALDSGDTKTAEQHYYAAFDVDSRVAQFDENGYPLIRDSFGGNYLGGLSMLGQRLSNAGSDDALETSLAFWRRVLERHPDAFGAAYNNAALTARDLGVKIAGENDAAGGPQAVEAAVGDRKQRLERAMELWETSYAWYEKAVRLSPDDPRIVNDCGLMLIYHLHRDYDRARELFDRAAVLGKQEIAALPADADEGTRQFLEEATGDALQNVGVLLQHRLGRSAAEWESFYREAVKYYPYQRREAARQLRLLESGVDQDKPDPRKAQFESDRQKASEIAKTGDFDGALTVLDGVRKAMNGYAPYHALRGEYSLRLAQQMAQNGGNVGTIDGLFADAVAQLERAVELDGEPVAPRQLLGEAQVVTGKYADAAKTMDSLMSHLRSRGIGDVAALRAAHVTRAEAAARAYVESQQSSDEKVKTAGKAMLDAARESMQELEKADALDNPLCDLWINAERWAGANAQALAIMKRSYDRDPRNRLPALVTLGAELGDSTPVIEALADSEDATTIWYRGRARFDRGVQHWAGGDGKVGVAEFDRAIADFRASMSANAGFRESCEQWIALCLGQKGIVQTSIEDLDGARESLLAAMKARPDQFTADLGGGSSIRQAVIVLADRYYGKNDLGTVTELYRAAGSIAPDDVQIANNEGLFCRDHATNLARSEPKLATELFEASYAAYSRAVRLDPENPRLLNDCAVILVHYLDREAEHAESMLRKALEVGLARRTNDPPSDKSEARDLDEAIGDAYGNLGRMYWRMTKDLDKATENYTKSLEFYPFERREGTRALQQIARQKAGQGGGENGK
jgi:tetratricopeptide (TPR) repeat protein